MSEEEKIKMAIDLAKQGIDLEEVDVLYDLIKANVVVKEQL